MARNAFPRGGRGRSRRLTEWGVGPGGTSVTTLTASGSSILGSGLITTEAATIIRIRGFFSGTLQTAGAIGEGFFGAVGIAKVQTQAFQAGIASLPTPISEADSDAWMWHSFFDIRSGVIGASDGSGVVRMEVDSKSMRKFEGVEETMFAAVEVVEIGSVDVDFFFDSRVLLMN